MSLSFVDQKNLSAAVASGRTQLVRQARRMLRSDEGAEDAAHDAVVAALRHLDAFRGDAQFGTWLFRVGANAVLMNMRSQRRAAARMARAAAEQSPGGSWLHGGCARGFAEAELERAQSAHHLRRVVAQLPERYRSVVKLCDLDDRPLEEVAQVLGLSVAGVRTRRLRAHRMLRTALADCEP